MRAFHVSAFVGAGAAAQGAEMAVNLKFKSMKDFTPEGIAQQVPEMRNVLPGSASMMAGWSLVKWALVVVLVTEHELAATAVANWRRSPTSRRRPST